MGIEDRELKAVRTDAHRDASEPVEQATIASSASVAEGTEKSDRGNEAVRGILYGVGLGLLLWGLVAGVAVALVVFVR
jgi:hypothetical protein